MFDRHELSGGAGRDPAPGVVAQHEWLSSEPADRSEDLATRATAGRRGAGETTGSGPAGMGGRAGGGVSTTASLASNKAVAVAAGIAAGRPIMPGTMSGFSHHCSPHGGKPGGTPLRCRRTRRWREISGQSGCPGPMPRRRQVHAMDCRTHRGSTRRGPAPSRAASPAGRATRTAARGRAADAGAGKARAGRGRERAIPADARTRLYQPDLDRGSRLRPGRCGLDRAFPLARCEVGENGAMFTTGGR